MPSAALLVLASAGSTFSARQSAYLRHATTAPLDPSSIIGVIAHLECARRAPSCVTANVTVQRDAWDGVLGGPVGAFQLLYALNALYAYEGDAAVEPGLWAAVREAALGFKYWSSDPPVDALAPETWYWSENKVLAHRTDELLAGQRFANATFSVTGRNGTWHAQRARRELLEWLDFRARFGFTEWHTDVYYQVDVIALLSLVEWSEDAALATRAAMVLDIVLIDIALHLHAGNFAATHGRSYAKDKPSAPLQDTFGLSKLLFDDTDEPYGNGTDEGATILARAQSYRMPELVRRIAARDAPMVSRQRMNLNLTEQPDPDPAVPPPPAPFGLDFEDEANLPFWWSYASQALWMMTPLLVRVAERDGLWDTLLADARVAFDLVRVEGDVEQTVANARRLQAVLWPMMDAALLNEVNTCAYRTRNFALSTAQDYRKGLRGAQTHPSQATLSGRAVVFTQHPAYAPALGDELPADFSWKRFDEPGPGYWTGNGAEPRAAQHENVALVIYAPQYPPLAPLGFPYLNETHAYFPQAHFDEVVRAGSNASWTFGRKGSAYVALFSLVPTTWRVGGPELFENGDLPFDLVAEGGASNVWITELGDAARWGSFARFRTAILSARVEATPLADQGADGMADGFDVLYGSPSVGEMRFGWHAPLVVNGSEVPLHDYPRYDNPYIRKDVVATLGGGGCGVDGRELCFAFRDADSEHFLTLDFGAVDRNASALWL
ncbi:hypothetical protein KFE25_011324 [Diacronema lutheri]|uniref:Uncharacterized protein n=1 Tax=Diacronema lutheri TaxID=2081491 RepID=A0A8J5X6T7_DIALT|nr:hypothetical protein KFE25_011324 [Diacronema lutheri]